MHRRAPLPASSGLVVKKVIKFLVLYLVIDVVELVIVAKEVSVAPPLKHA